MTCRLFLYAIIALIVNAVGPANAQGDRYAKQQHSGRSLPGSAPLLAIVSLGDQRVTIYGADGRMMQSPVSSGATGYETPAGIFSIVQKKEEHFSNLYQDGNMPFMQRITWTGIALHAGALPGYPASHGCVRLPSQFASTLFGHTELGMRIVIVPEDIIPAEIAHPLLFQPRPQPSLYSPSIDRSRPLVATRAEADELVRAGSPRYIEMLRSVAAERSAEAEAASRRAKQLKLVATRKVAEAAPAAKALRAAEASLVKAEEQQQDAEQLVESATSPEARAKAEEMKAKASAKVAEATAQLEAARAQAEAKKEAAARAEEEAAAAGAEHQAAQEAADAAGRRTAPVSVFISRKMQRLYIRQANQPVFEGPVTIRDPDKAIGTFIFTALKYANSGDGVHWNVVSMYKNPLSPETGSTGQRRKGSARNATAVATDVGAAKAALDRISMPQEVVDRIVDVLPGSSLIISDEAASIETGKDTDFVVVMSGEPQGALKTRSRPPVAQDGDLFGSTTGDGVRRRSPYAQEFQFPFLWK